MVLNDNLDALGRNHPDLIMFSPPPSVAPGLIDSVLRPYYAERRAGGGPLPVLFAFPPVPAGSAYLHALGDDVLVVNIIPNNVTTSGGAPIGDEGYYVCTFASPWPDDQVDLLRSLFDGQGAFVELEPHQLIPMLGGAATVSALWSAVPAIADLVGADHTEIGRHLRARLQAQPGAEPRVPNADILTALIDGWHAGVRQYYSETDIAPAQVRTLLERGFDLTLHTIEVEPREVLHGHSVGAATKGGVLEHAIRSTTDILLPQVVEALTTGMTDGLATNFALLVTEVCRGVREHGATLAG